MEDVPARYHRGRRGDARYGWLRDGGQDPGDGSPAAHRVCLRYGGSVARDAGLRGGCEQLHQEALPARGVGRTRPGAASEYQSGRADGEQHGNVSYRPMEVQRREGVAQRYGGEKRLSDPFGIADPPPALPQHGRNCRPRYDLGDFVARRGLLLCLSPLGCLYHEAT